MKKLLLFMLTLSALFISACKKDSWASPQLLPKSLDLSKEVDATKWLDNLDDGKIAAHQADKKIILFFSADNQDNVGQTLKDRLLTTDAFLQEATKTYVLVNLDFSNNPETTMKIVTVYGVEKIPTFFLLSKEGYVITPLIYDDTTDSFAQFEAEITAHTAEISEFEAALAKTTTGTALERVQAIDDFYRLIDPRQTYVFTPLAEEAVRLDPKNKSGLAGKYTLAIADALAIDAALDQDIEKMTDIFVQAAKTSILTNEERQQAYYYAGVFLAGGGSTDYNRIKNYIQLAIKAAPESSHVPQLTAFLQQVEAHATTSEESDASPAE